MFIILSFIFLAVPIAEIYLFIQVGGTIGAWWTIALVILTAVIGVLLLKQQGLSTLSRAQERIHHGNLPAQEILEGVALVIAGAFLLTPGFLTDSIGFLLIIPASRSAIVRRLVSKCTTTSHFGWNPDYHADINRFDADQQPPNSVIDGVCRKSGD